MLNEMQYFNVYLQNYKVGWNNVPGSVYKATYEATNMILIGKNVSPRTNVQPYEVLQNGNITCYAPQGIHITDGFHVFDGGIFHAYIAFPNYFIHQPCTNNHAPVAGSDGTNSNESDLILDELNAYPEKTEQNFSIYPNPSTGEVTLTMPLSDEMCTLTVFDLSGKLIHASQAKSGSSLNLLLPSGVYIVSLTSATGTMNKKLIVQ